MSAKLTCLVVVALGAGVAACLPRAPDATETETTEAAAAVEAAPLPASAPAEIAITQFPASYFGRWGLTPADCTRKNATGLLSLQGSLVKFYESTGTMENGKRETLNSMSADFAMMGEGNKWLSKTRYTLSEDRRNLTRHDLGSGEKFEYVRCSYDGLPAG